MIALYMIFHNLLPGNGRMQSQPDEFQALHQLSSERAVAV
jgi:hypothetical protein